MSLLFERAIRRFDPAEATLLDVTEDSLAEATDATTLYRDLYDHLSESGLIVDSADEIASAGR